MAKCTGLELPKPDGDHSAILNSGKWEQAIQGCLAASAFADAQVGRMIEESEKSRHRDNTITCLWSDHGSHLGEKHHWRKYPLWQEATCARLNWVVSSVTEAGSGCNRPIDCMSLYPTLTDFHGIATPKHVEGASLRPLLTDPQAVWKRPAITTYLQNSHTILLAGGEKKTLGLIYAGKFHLGTGKAERMEITAGACRVKIDGSRKTHDYAAGTHFEVPANSGFDIEVADGICEYVCSFLD